MCKLNDIPCGTVPEDEFAAAKAASEDAALAESYRSGDDDAFNEAFKRIECVYTPPIYKYLRHRLSVYGYRDNLDYRTQDLLLEFFVHAIKKRSKFNPAIGNLTQWFYMLAGTVLRDFLRKENKRLKPFQTAHPSDKDKETDIPHQPIRIYPDAKTGLMVKVYPPASNTDTSPSFSEKVVDISDPALIERLSTADCPVEDLIFLDEVLAKLSRDEYDVILHTMVLERSAKETAEILAIREGTVWSRKCNALRKLQEFADVKKAG